ncbi:ATP-binding protein [Parashewanella curva]|uniref:ATP-binding protein n=1 Tax=Parashewanella curva TaxID=2338552 RepID=UPI0014052304|nr:ATP-binding protein [Parashewanella curva]
MLLSGPSGTGKTAWAHYLAQQHDLGIMHIKCSDVLGKYVGESEQNLAGIFIEAQRDNKLILFDEVDSLLSRRESASSHHEVQLTNELLTLLEGSQQPVFAATNSFEAIDKAVLRRFDFKLECDYLTSIQAASLYKHVLSIEQLTAIEIQAFRAMSRLTAGDFAILSRKKELYPSNNFRNKAIAILQQENRYKPQTKPVGFIH